MVRLLESWSVCPGAGRHMVWDSMVPGAGFVRMEGLSVAVREPWGYVPIVTTPPNLTEEGTEAAGQQTGFFSCIWQETQDQKMGGGEVWLNECMALWLIGRQWSDIAWVVRTPEPAVEAPEPVPAWPYQGVAGSPVALPY